MLKIFYKTLEKIIIKKGLKDLILNPNKLYIIGLINSNSIILFYFLLYHCPLVIAGFKFIYLQIIRQVKKIKYKYSIYIN